MQLDAKEEPSKRFHIDECSFPFTVKCPARLYKVSDYGDVAEMLTNPIGGLSMIKHALTLSVKVGRSWKPISLESLANNPLVAHYMAAYSEATAPTTKGYLFRGHLLDQPNILYGMGQAFYTIRNSIAECEAENHRVLRQQANTNNGRQ